MDFVQNPTTIEETSMGIIEENLPALLELPKGEREIIKRIVHTTGDFDIASIIKIHPDAVDRGTHALKSGKPIFTDVRMLESGINKNRLEALGVQTVCRINEPLIVEEAKKTGKTRAMTALNMAAGELDGSIIAIGNAPTALFELCDLYAQGKLKPALVVGTPVGFVGAKESKEVLVESGLPYITVTGTRGGSTIAVAAINALLRLL